MGAWIITVIGLMLVVVFGVAVLLTVSLVAHSYAPVNRVQPALRRGGIPRALLYLLTVYPVFSFLFFLSPLEAYSTAGLAFCYGHVLLCIPAVEAAYQFRKLNQWNSLWLVLDAMAGGWYVILILGSLFSN